MKTQRISLCAHLGARKLIIRVFKLSSGHLAWYLLHFYGKPIGVAQGHNELMCRITLCLLFTTSVSNPILIALSVAVLVTWWPAWAPLSRPGLLRAYSREHRLGLLIEQETGGGDDVFAGLFKFDFMKATTATTNICFDTLKSFRGVQTYPCGMPSPFNSRRKPSPV